MTNLRAGAHSKNRATRDDDGASADGAARGRMRIR
jgi:hypothetical protein